MVDWELIQKERETAQLQSYLKTNDYTMKFGLSLSKEEAGMLVASHKKTLKDKQRFEFGEGILPKLIFAFCDSAYVNQREYKSIMMELDEIFYEYKNESMDLLTDDELVEYMRKSFENECFGSLEYLRGTALVRLVRKLRMEHEGIWQEDD